MKKNITNAIQRVKNFDINEVTGEQWSGVATITIMVGLIILAAVVLF